MNDDMMTAVGTARDLACTMSDGVGRIDVNTSSDGDCRQTFRLSPHESHARIQHGTPIYMRHADGYCVGRGNPGDVFGSEPVPFTPAPDPFRTTLRDVGRDAVMDAYGQRVPADLLDAWAQGERNGARPYIVCPECGGLRCDLCSHRGWLRSGEAERDACNRGPGLEPLSDVRARFRIKQAGRAMSAAVPGLGEAVREQIRILACVNCGDDKRTAHRVNGSWFCEDKEACGWDASFWAAGTSPPRVVGDTARRLRDHLASIGVPAERTLSDVLRGLVTPADVAQVPFPVESLRTDARAPTIPAPEAAPRCPSCDSSRYMRKTDHDAWFCAGTCGGWHGRELTPPVVPRFAPGQWARVDDAASNLHGVTVQIVEALDGDRFRAVRPRSDTLTRRTRKSGCGEVTSVYAGAMLVATERPR